VRTYVLPDALAGFGLSHRGKFENLH